jgi:protein MpaA
MEIELIGNKVNPSVLIIGVFHGDEPQGNYLIKNYLKLAPNTNLLMIPCLNPTGFVANSRTNINGVDLNRNFPTKNWIFGEKNQYFGGNAPASEEETRFLISVIEKYNPNAILTLHTPYKIVNYDGGQKDGSGRNLADKISKIIGYPVEESVGYPTPGSFGTWAGVERDIPTITLEMDEEISLDELKIPVFDIFRMLENYSR